MQTVATTAEPPEAIAEQLDAERVIEVKEGEIDADEKSGKK